MCCCVGCSAASGWVSRSRVRCSRIGKRCHELRIVDVDVTWRLVYRIDPDAIVIAEVFKKKTPTTPKAVIDACRRRLSDYDALAGAKE